MPNIYTAPNQLFINSGPKNLFFWPISGLQIQKFWPYSGLDTINLAYKQRDFSAPPP